MAQAFEPPIHVRSSDVHASIREIRSAQDASAFLTDWPAAKRTSLSYREAATACAAAVEKDGEAERARQAFIGFARDMDILVRL